MTTSSVGAICMTSPGVISARWVSWRETIMCDSQGARRWPV